ncbi:hypothetical protein FB382_000177 [Nocardioides ginsengisegetis]|uniref:Uncharacterized protein n=1 Tax=Nocardioides ginsengisegetis TaxID=661491 RepID=A0A7W3IWG4_9ACTN|nr:protealysin inhibitor emfourin [Nocardioides ginsengisegetis]MBA8801886.1 hypothetical protein [Nocardioides ginsengisegetis]
MTFTPSGPSGPSSLVRVRRTGGFAGRVAEASLDLDGDDPRVAEARALLAAIDVRRLRGGDPHPDLFIYAFDLAGPRVTVPEQLLTEELRRLVELVFSG